MSANQLKDITNESPSSSATTKRSRRSTEKINYAAFMEPELLGGQLPDSPRGRGATKGRGRGRGRQLPGKAPRGGQQDHGEEGPHHLQQLLGGLSPSLSISSPAARRGDAVPLPRHS